MSRGWKAKTLKSEEEVVAVLLDLQAKRWLSRGQSKDYKSLKPSIDREKLAHLSRREKLQLERQSIDVFRATAKFFAGDGEQNALNDDFIALMVLRHYGVTTRLLDWSSSPFVAAYFAVCCDDDKDGEIWSFDQRLYGEKGKEQWRRHPETTTDRSGNPDKWDGNLTAFMLEEPPDWFVAIFYPTGFPRQNIQHGVYSVTARFGRCHAEAIEELLDDESAHRRYVIKRALKPKLRTLLREGHGVWRGSLFPDSAGAAGTAGAVFPNRSDCG
jgi:hypothetical protein